MPRQLTTIGCADLGIGRGRLDFEDRAGLFDGHPLGWQTLASTALPQRGLEMHKLQRRDTEHRGDPQQQRARSALQIRPLDGGAHLDLEEDPQQVRSSGTRPPQGHDCCGQLELRRFAAGEVLDGRSDLDRIEPELVHHGTRRTDFAFGNPPIGLGDMAHDFKGAAEKCGCRPFGAAFQGAAAGRVVLGVDDVTGQCPKGRARRPADQQPNEATHEFAGPLHVPILPGLMRDPPPLHTSSLRSLCRLHSGKVRDLYEVDADTMLIVTTDRLSAFDVVLPDPIPRKGWVLTEISKFWFAATRPIIPNHLTGLDPSTLGLQPDEREQIAGRALLVRRLQALPLEAVVRGYLIGSGWKDYQRTGRVCDIALPSGLQQAERLPTPLFTPASKAPAGEHDENIAFAAVESLIGPTLAAQVRDVSMALYRHAAAHALARGIIIADTKFEFGIDAAGRLTLIDEALTPDSSRFWPADTYRTGVSPPSFDKQFVRDHLETLDWNKRAPGPRLPATVIARTSELYVEALRRLTGPATR